MTDDSGVEEPKPGVEELKERIALTRTDLGETVEALAAKADVKARASGAVHDAVDSARSKAHNAVGAVKAKAHGATDSARSAADATKDKVTDAAGAARDKVGDVADTARGKAAAVAGRSGKHAGDPEQTAALNSVYRDTGLVVSADEPDGPAPGSSLDRRVQGALLATAVGAMVAAVVIWLSGRRSS